MLKTMKLTRGVLFPLLFVAFSNVSFSQTEVHSGILHVKSEIEEFNSLKLHSNEPLNESNLSKISKEFEKYPEFIASYKFNVADSKVYLKFKGVDTNFILGILTRVSIDTYYLDNGVEVRYVKNPSDNFKF